jgi:hypothetical protein
MGVAGGAVVLRAGEKRIGATAKGALKVGVEGPTNVTPNIIIENEQLPHAGLGVSFEPFHEIVEKKLESGTAEASTPSETSKTKYVTGIICTLTTTSGGPNTAKIEIRINASLIIKDQIGVPILSHETPGRYELSGFPIMPLRKADRLHVLIISPNSECTVTACVFGCVVNGLESGGA